VCLGVWVGVYVGVITRVDRGTRGTKTKSYLLLSSLPKFRHTLL
jgi:hypothetical protein